MITSVREIESMVYKSLVEYRERGIRGYDFETRSPEYARDLLDAMGNPDRGTDLMIVTGSKGKGSTSRMISSLLSRSGKRTGLFSSPHLVDFNERIRVDGRAISDEDFIRIANMVEPELNELAKSVPDNKYIGPIGVLLVIAMIYFKEQNVDIAVMEVGVGGKFDEVNVLDNRWAVMTPVLREHLDRLGPSLEDVVENKTAIVKPKTEKVFVGKQTAESLSLLRKTLRTKMATAFIYGRDFKDTDVRVEELRTKFNLTLSTRQLGGLSLPLHGTYQAQNAALAVMVVEEVLGGTGVSKTVVHDCFRDLVWPGRCEVVGYEPMVVLDGTIHRSSVAYLKEWLGRFNFLDCSVILSIPADKDYKGVIEEISDIADRIVLTKPKFSLREYPKRIEEFGRKHVKFVYSTETLDEALEVANETAPDLILILGSQHIIGEAMRKWDHSLRDLGK